MNFYIDYLIACKERIGLRLASFPLAKAVANNVIVGVLTITIFYLSLIATSAPVSEKERREIDRALAVLEEKGFEKEAFILRHTATFRGGGNWLNSYTNSENAYAATNFPFGIITIYPDFYSKAVDETERAMILLHEARHMQGGDEHDAYAFVWQNREQLGWTILRYGVTPTFITVEEETRSVAPELFTCTERLFDDCTVFLRKNPVRLIEAEKAERSNLQKKTGARRRQLAKR